MTASLCAITASWVGPHNFTMDEAYRSTGIVEMKFRIDDGITAAIVFAQCYRVDDGALCCAAASTGIHRAEAPVTSAANISF